MTAVTPSAAAVKPVPRTVVRQPAEPPERRSAARFDRASGSDTKSLKIPPGKAINISVVSGVSQGLEFELSRPLMTIGRVGGEADIQIDDLEVSRLHCAVEVRGNTILLSDLGSTNGTFVDNSRVLATRLKKLSQFRIGSSYLEIDILSSTNRHPKASRSSRTDKRNPVSHCT
jgi:pSer/pThr/pTyr-binding forkhead associated (FHA) protein